MLREGLVDELLLYLAPHLLGDAARGMFDLPALEDLSGRHELKIHDLSMVGDDIRVIARVVKV
jgi:diaminohydroxyphosphoribosylaminopyrimidine deaminase/5-amino-6-(5-phosphoribosylamino)uracil reductase